MAAGGDRQCREPTAVRVATDVVRLGAAGTSNEYPINR
jgi:hypothetical protein